MTHEVLNEMIQIWKGMNNNNNVIIIMKDEGYKNWIRDATLLLDGGIVVRGTPRPWSSFRSPEPDESTMQKGFQR